MRLDEDDGGDIVEVEEDEATNDDNSCRDDEGATAVRMVVAEGFTFITTCFALD